LLAKERQQITSDQHRKRQSNAKATSPAIEPQYDDRPENTENKWRDGKQYSPLPDDLGLDLFLTVCIGRVFRQLREAEFLGQKICTRQFCDQVAPPGLDRKPHLADAFRNILSLPG